MMCCGHCCHYPKGMIIMIDVTKFGTLVVIFFSDLMSALTLIISFLTSYGDDNQGEEMSESELRDEAK